MKISKNMMIGSAVALLSTLVAISILKKKNRVSRIRQLVQRMKLVRSGKTMNQS